MPLAEVLKPVVAEAHKAILGADHQPLDEAQFDLFDDLIEAFPLVVQSGPNIFDPLVNFDPVFQAVGPQGFLLESQVFFLRGEDTRAYAITNPCCEEINPRYCKYCSCV